MLEKYLKHPSERKYSGVYTDADIGLPMKYGRVGVNKYKGRQIMHEPMFLNALRNIIDYERPSYVLEFGSFQGGLTSFMSDTALIHGHNMRIISFDWDIYESPNQIPVPNSEFVPMDVLDINNYLITNHESIIGLEGQKVIIDDIGINTVELLTALEPYMSKGDHFICCHTLDMEIHDKLMEAASENYSVNTQACDAFGENFIENPNGFLIKTS
jgi:cephalosporin hydroxylase